MSFKQRLLRIGFSIARGILPVVHYKKYAFVFRYSDVLEVLKRDKDFLIAPINAQNIQRHIGPFMLGMDESPRLEHEHKAMYAIVKREDQARIRAFVRKEASSIIAAAKAKGGKFDLITEFTRIVPLRMVGDYFGISGCEEAEMLRWNRLIFWDIFVNFKDEPVLREQALTASGALKAYMEEIIQNRIALRDAGHSLPDDLVSRLVLAQNGDGPSLDADGIRRNLAGSLLGAEEPISRVCVQALDVLLQRPKALAMAQAAAMKDDVETVGRILFDALRFKPSNPVLIRKAEQAQYIGPEGGKKRRIKASKTVYAVTLSAMFDPKAFPDPEEIKSDRPYDHYLHFGWGQHVCYGSYVNYVAIPEMMTALLKEGQSLRQLGPPSYEGTFPDKWIWEFC
jgi:cytochrome P450